MPTTQSPALQTLYGDGTFAKIFCRVIVSLPSENSYLYRGSGLYRAGSTFACIDRRRDMMPSMDSLIFLFYFFFYRISYKMLYSNCVWHALVCVFFFCMCLGESTYMLHAVGTRVLLLIIIIVFEKNLQNNRPTARIPHEFRIFF